MLPVKLPQQSAANAGSLSVTRDFLTEIVVGERAEFSFSWLGLVVSKGFVEVKEQIKHRGRDVWHVVVHVKTTRFLDLFFPIRDEYHSFIDVETLQSLRFEKNVLEGKYRADEVVEFDHEHKRGYYFSRLNKSEKSFETAPVIHDPISAVYWFRAKVPLAAGEEITVPVNYEEQNWELRVSMVAKEKLKSPEMGERMAVKVKPYIVDLEEHVGDWTEEHRQMLRKSRLTVWVDEAGGRIPLKMTVHVPFIGVVKAYTTQFNSPALSQPLLELTR